MSTIVKNTFFVGDIFLPEAKPTITSDVSDIDSTLLDFLNDKEEECLSKCLGELYFEFISKVNLSNDNGLIDGAEEKWDWLLNGRKEYLNPEGKKRTFKGLRYKSINGEDAKYDRSLIAFYIYYFFKRETYITTTSIGSSIPKSKNSEVVSPSSKMTSAWRKFYKATMGAKTQPMFYQGKHGFGIDYYKSDSIFCSLYTFINDMNNLNENTYENFNPFNWTNENQAGI